MATTHAVDNELELIEIGSEDAGVWNKFNEAIFISLMEEEVIKGNRSTTTFGKNAWRRIREELSARTNRNYTDSQLRNKFNQLRQKQKDFKALLKETGIGYNSVSGDVTASDDVWEKLFKVHKFAKKFKKKGCPFYDKLCTIYGDTTATGKYSHPSTRSPSDTDDEEDHDFDMKKEEESSDGSPTPQGQTQTQNQNQNQSTNSRSKKRTSYSAALTSALFSISETQKRKIDMMEKSNDSGKNTNLLDDSMNALNELEGIDGASYARAIALFHADELWRQMFLKMPVNRKIDWVLNLK